MKRKWGILAVVILLAVVAAGLWACFRPHKAIAITGNLTTKEIAEIRSAVKKDMRQRVFPNFSWASIKALPARAKWYFKRDLRSIDARRSGHVYVTVYGSASPEIGVRDRYEVVRGTNGWKAYHRPETKDIYDNDIF